MKDYLRQLLRDAPSPLEGRSIAREYLQARVLGVLQEAGAFHSIAFHGGTSLRFLYQIPRYSEDLDFALERNRDGYDFRRLIHEIQRQLAAETYEIEARVKDNQAVNKAELRFRGLLHELGISPHSDETLMIKIEVDTNPPQGATTETTVIRRYVLLNLLHHDRASLLAGRVHAILQRSYVKGRDLYDLYWYLANPDWPEPNFTMLNSALEQTNWGGARVNSDNWRDILRSRLDQISWETAVKDVKPFLMNPKEVSMLTPDTLHRLLQG